MRHHPRTPALIERLEDRRLLAVGPDAYGYTADATPYQSINLTAGQSGVVTLMGGTTADDDRALPIPLGTDSIRFYGKTYTGAASLYASTNGLLTFGAADPAFANTDLTAAPPEPTLAPLWTDLVANNSPSAVLYKFLDDDGNGTRDRLVVEWSDVNVYKIGTSPVTFQAILGLNPTAASEIVFNYPDLDAGAAVANDGASATVGIKDGGAQGGNRLLVSYNSTASGLVASAKAVKLSAPVPLGSLAGVAYDDANNNGARDPGEAAAAGRTVYLDSNNSGTLDAAEPRVTTDTDGAYFLGGLAAGTYRLRQVVPAGYAATAPAAGLYTVALAAGQSASGLNFGTRALPGSISGVKWNDLNGDGLRGSGEPGIAGWQIFLDTNGDGTYEAGEPSRLTAADGSYSFLNLTPGLYSVAEEQRAGWVQTSPGGGSASVSSLTAAARAGGAPAGGIVKRTAAVESAFGRLSDLAQYDPKKLAATTSWVIDASADPSLDASALAKTLKATVSKSDVLPGAIVADFAAGSVAKQVAKRLAKLGVPFYPLVATAVSTRAAPPNDPKFGQQWYLNNTGQYGTPAGLDVHALPAWDTSRGAGVVIGVVDDGVSYTHPDLAAHYRADLDYDFLGGSATPPADGEHGTSVAGVAAAVGGNGIGVSGVAPDAQLTNLRLIPETVADEEKFTDALVASALHYNDQILGVYNNSWGPNDDGQHLFEGPGPLTLATLDQSAQTGRGGLGSIYAWAAGNGLAFNENVNYDGYASNRHVIAVGAIDATGRQASYSEPGAPMLVTTYSSGNSSVPAITTTAYSAAGNGYTSGFGGTSSATPLVSGVIALMLSANPTLSARDVKHILVETATRNDPADAGWAINGAGRWVNHKYGFGAVDAAAAVAKAVGWKTVGPELSASSGRVAVNAAIPDNSAAGVSSSVTISAPILTEGVEVVLKATHARRGDLRVVLTGPSGTKSVLAEKHSDAGADYNDWVFTTTHDWDELAAGTWTLTVSDAAGGTVGTFDSWQLNVYGRAGTPGARYVQVAPGQARAGIDFGNRDLNPPRVASSTFNFLTGHSASLAFSESVAATLDSSDLTLRNLDTGATLPATLASYDAATNTATVGFSPAVLPDGNYRLTISAAGVADAQGTPMAADAMLDFFALAGDANRDRRVDLLDTRTALIHRGQAGTFADGDFNYDGVVTDADVQVALRNYNKVLAPPPAASSASAPATPVVLTRSPAAVSRTPLAFRPAPLAPVRAPVAVAAMRRPSLFSTLPITAAPDADQIDPLAVTSITELTRSPAAPA